MSRGGVGREGGVSRGGREESREAIVGQESKYENVRITLMISFKTVKREGVWMVLVLTKITQNSPSHSLTHTCSPSGRLARGGQRRTS